MTEKTHLVVDFSSKQLESSDCNIYIYLFEVVVGADRDQKLRENNKVIDLKLETKASIFLEKTWKWMRLYAQF